MVEVTTAGQRAQRVRTEGHRVWIAGAREAFQRHFDEQEAGLGTPWAERCDTYMYLAKMRTAGWQIDYADLITIAGILKNRRDYDTRFQDRRNFDDASFFVRALVGFTEFGPQL